MSIVALSADAVRLAKVHAAAAVAGMEVHVAGDLKELSHEMLRDDTEVVLLDVEHPRVDPLEAVRLVKGTRWDVRLLCIGAGEGAARAQRAGAWVEPSSRWDALGL